MFLLSFHVGQVHGLYLISMSCAGTLENEKIRFVESKLLNKFRMLRNKQEKDQQRANGWLSSQREISCLLLFLPFL